MPVWSRRRPTPGERALASSVFGPCPALNRLWLIQLGGPVRAAFVVNAHMMVFHGGWPASCDFSQADIPAQGLFVHELTHVMQAQAGVLLPIAKLGALGARAYRYRIEPGRSFAAYGLEQQAEIVRHAFLLARGVRDATIPPGAALHDYRAMGAPGAGCG